MEGSTRRRTLLANVLAALALAAAYGSIGRLSLWLAIPPGYATGLWLPSGLALAAVLIGGPRVWPGIWLGSFMVNIGMAFDSTNQASLLTSVAVPSSIGAGAVVQALVAAALVRRSIGFPNALTGARHIGAFLLLGGPVSCLISATVGATTLAVSGRIPWATYPLQWGTWWVGDTFGVLITIPLVLSWFAEPRVIWHRRQVSVALPLMGALALSLVIFAYSRAQEETRLRLFFAGQTEGLTHTIQTQLDDYLEVLHGIGSFYANTAEVSPQALQTFVQRSFTRHLGLQALVWDPHLPTAWWAASDEAAQELGYLSFQIAEQNADGRLVSLAWRSESLTDTATAPPIGDERGPGFDLASTPSYREALRLASDTGQLRASGRLTLQQKPIDAFGLLVSLPIYRSGLPPATVEGRRQNLHGYVTGVFRIGAMVEASLQDWEWQGIVLRIEDEAAPADQRMLYDSRWRAVAATAFAPRHEPADEPAGWHWKTTVEFAGRHWGLHFTPTHGYLATRQSLQPWAALGGGLVFTSLLGTLLMIVTGRSIVIEKLMVDRTAQLAASKRLQAVATQRRRTAESLAEVGRLLSQSLDPVEVGQQVVDHVQKLLQARAAALYRLDPASGMLVALAVRDAFGLAATPWRLLSPEMGVVGLAVQTREPVVTTDVLSDPRITLPTSVRAGLATIPVCAVLALPLLRDGRVIGAFSVEDDCGRVFDEEATELARLFADQAATALANAQLYDEVQTARERLQVLSRRLLEAQEAERRRIAHELHDEAGQLLTSVHLALAEAVSRLPPRFWEAFDQVRGHLDDIEAQLRRLSHELRPTILDDLGLLPALQFFVEGVRARTRLPIDLDYSIVGRLEPHVETALYRIMQEGITNVIKHAAATHVQLQLRRDGQKVYARLHDNGVGFAVDQELHRKGTGGLGLIGIQERVESLGGTLQITSAPGGGTTLQIMLPAEGGEGASGADHT